VVSSQRRGEGRKVQPLPVRCFLTEDRSWSPDAGRTVGPLGCQRYCFRRPGFSGLASIVVVPGTIGGPWSCLSRFPVLHRIESPWTRRPRRRPGGEMLPVFLAGGSAVVGGPSVDFGCLRPSQCKSVLRIRSGLGLLGLFSGSRSGRVRSRSGNIAPCKFRKFGLRGGGAL